MADRAQFATLIRDEAPFAMQVAEDLLLEHGWKLGEATGTRQANDFTIDLTRLGQSKIVQVAVRPLGEEGKAFSGMTVAAYTVMHGAVRMCRHETKYTSTIEAAKKQAIATAWAIAKRVKGLPISISQETIEAIVDAAINAGLDNVYYNEDLF